MVCEVAMRTKEKKQGGGIPVGGVLEFLSQHLGKALLRKRGLNNGQERAQWARIRRFGSPRSEEPYGWCGWSRVHPGEQSRV